MAAGAALLAVRSHGHNLALDQAPLAFAEEIHNPALTSLMRGGFSTKRRGACVLAGQS